MGIGSHVWRVHGEGKGFSPTKGMSPWNKGLTKETDERVKKNGETFSKRVTNGTIVPWQTGLSKFTNENIMSSSLKTKQTVQNKIRNDEWHVSFAKISRYEYNGIVLHGTWELAYAKWLDENHVLWSRPRETFPYTWKDEIHQYTPDFYLPDEDIYVEIKGYETERDRAKWINFPKKLRILKGQQLKELGLIDSFKPDTIR